MSLIEASTLESNSEAFQPEQRAKLRNKYLEMKLLGQTHETTLSIEYSGSGDEGGVVETSVKDDEVSDFLYTAMWKYHEGYKNNNGGDGTVSWDLLTDVITINHNENFMSSTPYEHVL